MKKEYSLIELVVVAILVAILMSTAALSISRIQEGRALERLSLKW